MGYYIEVPNNLNKAQQLINLYGAKRIPRPNKIPEYTAIICVVENGFFCAAVYCYSNKELQEFADPSDSRRKTWLEMDKDLAEKLSGFKK
jgi:hypothetical protein